METAIVIVVILGVVAYGIFKKRKKNSGGNGGCPPL